LIETSQEKTGIGQARGKFSSEQLWANAEAPRETYDGLSRMYWTIKTIQDKAEIGQACWDTPIENRTYDICKRFRIKDWITHHRRMISTFAQSVRYSGAIFEKTL